MLFCCSFSSFNSLDYFTFQKRQYMGSFSPLKSCRKPGLKILRAESLTTLWKKKKKKKPKKDAKRCPTDFLICLSDISPGTGAAGPPTSLRRAVLNGAISNRETVTASVWCWPTVTTGGGEAINQTSEGGGSSWGCGGSSGGHHKVGKGLWWTQGLFGLLCVHEESRPETQVSKAREQSRQQFSSGITRRNILWPRNTRGWIRGASPISGGQLRAQRGSQEGTWWGYSAPSQLQPALARLLQEWNSPLGHSLLPESTSKPHCSPGGS